MSRKSLTRDELDALWEDPSSWRWGVIYQQPADPRVIVPRRLKWGGWTINTAHPSRWWVFLLVMAFATLPTLVAVSLGAGPNQVLVLMLLTVVGVIGVAHWESSRDRT